MQLNILQIVNVARSVRNENEDYESKSNKITKDRDFMFKKQNIYIYEHQQQHTKYHTCKIDHCTDTYYQLSKKIIHYPLVKQHLMSLSSHCYDLFFSSPLESYNLPYVLLGRRRKMERRQEAHQEQRKQREKEKQNTPYQVFSLNTKGRPTLKSHAPVKVMVVTSCFILFYYFSNFL